MDQIWTVQQFCASPGRSFCHGNEHRGIDPSIFSSGPSWLFHKGCLSLNCCQTAILPHLGTLNSAYWALSTFQSSFIWAISFGCSMTLWRSTKACLSKPAKITFGESKHVTHGSNLDCTTILRQPWEELLPWERTPVPQRLSFYPRWNYPGGPVSPICSNNWGAHNLRPYRKASPPPQSLTQRYHRSRVSIKKGLLQKGHDHMLWSKITTHYLQSCTVWVDLAIAFCRHNCLNKS